MLTERELGTVLAALRFWQSHGPPRPSSVFDRLGSDEQDVLDEIRPAQADLIRSRWTRSTTFANG